MKVSIAALIWPDGRVFAIRDSEISNDLMINYHCPYTDTASAEQVKLEINIPNEKCV